MTAELARVEQWLYSTLAADPTIAGVVGTRIYADEAPQEAAFPLIVFAHIGNVDVLNSFGNGRVAKVIYLVRAVAKGSSVNPILSVADRFDPLLLVNNVTVGTTYINYVQHFQHAIRKDSENGVPLSYLGSYYYIFCQPAP
jgi:hypothetical protein